MEGAWHSGTFSEIATTSRKDPSRMKVPVKNPLFSGEVLNEGPLSNIFGEICTFVREGLPSPVRIVFLISISRGKTRSFDVQEEDIEYQQIGADIR